MADIRTFFSLEDTEEILSAIAGAEARTSGEIRVRIEKKAGRDPLAKARAAFEDMGMRATEAKSGVMFYVSVEDRRFAILGDDGINEKVPGGFWDSVKDAVLAKFRQKQFAIGLAGGINMAGEKLAEYFPFERATGMNCLTRYPMKNNFGFRIADFGLKKKILFLLSVLVAVTAAALQAEPAYPQAQEKYVNDFAGILTSTDRATIGEMLKNLEKQTGIEMTIVTIKTVSDYSTGDPDIETFSTNLFNSWGVGRKKDNNGIMMLVSRDDRRMRIELGEGYGFVYDAAMQQVIEKTMLPFFKGGYYSRAFTKARAK